MRSSHVWGRQRFQILKSNLTIHYKTTFQDNIHWKNYLHIIINGVMKCTDLSLIICHCLTLNYFEIQLPKWSHEDDTTQECYEYHHWPYQQRRLQKDYWEVSLKKKNAIEENPYKIVQENGSFNMEDMIYGIPFMTIKIKGDPYHYSQNPNPRGIKTNKNNQYQSSKIPKGIILQDYCQFQKEWSQRQRPKW